MVDGGPSVLFDAVAILTSQAGWSALSRSHPVHDFINDAFAHKKFIAYSESTIALFAALGLADSLDEGCLQLKTGKDAKEFVTRCSKLRLWARTEHRGQ